MPHIPIIIFQAEINPTEVLSTIRGCLVFFSQKNGAQFAAPPLICFVFHHSCYINWVKSNVAIRIWPLQGNSDVFRRRVAVSKIARQSWPVRFTVGKKIPHKLNAKAFVVHVGHQWGEPLVNYETLAFCFLYGVLEPSTCPFLIWPCWVKRTSSQVI